MTIHSLNDYLCPLWTFVPFTNDYQDITATLKLNETGFYHMAASILAMKNFNERDASMVPELGDQFMQDCPVQFDLNNSRFFDSGQYSHVASEDFMDALLLDFSKQEGSSSTTIPGEDKFPCAIAGSYYDTPALDLGGLAQTIKIPMVAHRVLAPHFLDLDASGTYSSQVYPSASGTTEIVLKVIERMGRKDYLTVLYPTTEMGTQVQKAFLIHFEQRNVQHHFTQYYVHPGREAILEDPTTRGSLRYALVKVKERGFRTIITILQYAETEIPLYAQLAEELGMNNGDYFWVWVGMIETVFPDDDLVNRLMDGSIFIQPFEPFLLFPDKFSAAVFNITDPEIPDLITAMNPLVSGQHGYIEASVDLFYNNSLIKHSGMAFMYDAVMTIGIGACKAYEKKQQDNNNMEKAYVQILGLEHVQGIRSADFEGVSGRVRFKNEGQAPGTRKSEDLPYVAWNIVPYDLDTPLFSPSTLYVGNNTALYPEVDSNVAKSFSVEDGESWFDYDPFVYFGGSSEPPLLRDQPKMNYLSSELRSFGFFLLAFVWAASLFTVIFVYNCAAQPYYLYLLCFGAFVFSSAIIPLSFDEGYGWNEGQLTVACRSTPWLATIGYIIIYGALFSKLFRANKVLQCTKRKFELYQVTWPVMVFLGLDLLVLTVWTAAFPLHWERKELNGITGESIGMCASDHLYVFSGLLAVLAVVPLVFTAVMAWTTIDVDDAFSESKWILILILLQPKMIVLGSPVLTFLRYLSTNGRYIGFVIFIWAFSISALVVIMLPKVIAYRAAVNGTDGRQSSIRGQKAGVVISGVYGSQDMPHSTPLCGSVEDNSAQIDNLHVGRVRDQIVWEAYPDPVEMTHVQKFSANSNISRVHDESTSIAAPHPAEIEVSAEDGDTRRTNAPKSCGGNSGQLAEGTPELVLLQREELMKSLAESLQSQELPQNVLNEIAILVETHMKESRIGSADDSTDLISLSALVKESV